MGVQVLLFGTDRERYAEGVHRLARRCRVGCGSVGVVTVRVRRTGLPASARLALGVLGVLAILVGWFARGILLESAEGAAGERAANPDGTVSYWNPEGSADVQYDLRADDGSNYSGNGPAFVWIIGRGGDGIEPVFEGSTPEEAEAYIRSQGEVYFTGTPAEADAWAEAKREQQRSSLSPVPSLMIIVGIASILFGLWPGRRSSQDSPTPELT